MGCAQRPLTTLGTRDPIIWSQWRHRTLEYWNGDTGHRTLEYWRHNLKYPHNSGETDQLQILMLMLLMEGMIYGGLHPLSPRHVSFFWSLYFWCKYGDIWCHLLGPSLTIEAQALGLVVDFIHHEQCNGDGAKCGKIPRSALQTVQNVRLSSVPWAYPPCVPAPCPGQTTGVLLTAHPHHTTGDIYTARNRYIPGSHLV